MDDQLKQLMDYTRFHIGMYTTLASLLIGVLTVDKVKLVKQEFANWLFFSLVLLAAAGMAGGMVGSSIPRFTRYESFVTAKLGPWDSEWLLGATWIHLEHTFFWASILIALLGAGRTAVGWREAAHRIAPKFRSR